MKYIIFDLDDTLLNNESKIGEYTLKVLKQYQAAGHKLVFNTARSYARTKEYIDVLHPDYSILAGGACIYNKEEELIYCDAIEKELVNKVVADLMPYINEEGLSIETAYESYSLTGYKGAPLLELPFKEDAIKIVTNASDLEKTKEIAEKHNLYYIYYYQGPWGRITKPGATKWLGIVKLLELTNGQIADTISFGDDFGDLEMLQNCAIGVAMANSQPNVLSGVTIINKYTNDEDGVARYLEDNLPL